MAAEHTDAGQIGLGDRWLARVSDRAAPTRLAPTSAPHGSPAGLSVPVFSGAIAWDLANDEF
jgi:hypothetical protein